MNKKWTEKCTCENFQQNEDCEHIGNKVLEEVGMQVEDSMGSYHIANTHIEGGELVDIGIKDGCGQPMLMQAIDPKEDCCPDKGTDGTDRKRTETNESGVCSCRCHLPLVTTHLCPNCFNGCPPRDNINK